MKLDIPKTMLLTIGFAIPLTSVLANDADIYYGGSNIVMGAEAAAYQTEPRNNSWDNVVIGNRALGGMGGIALGLCAKSYGAVSVGYGSCGHYSSVSLGDYTYTDDYGVAVGSAANANFGALALGWEASAFATNSIALGRNSIVPAGRYGVQILQGTLPQNTLLQVGNYRLLDSEGKIPAERLPENHLNETDPTVPAWAKQPEKPTYTVVEIPGALSTNSTVFAGATGAGQDSLAIGYRATAQRHNGIAIGSFATAEYINGIAIGRNSLNTGGSSIAMGVSSRAFSDGVTAIGLRATGREPRTIAIGMDSNAAETNSVAIGYKATVPAGSGQSIQLLQGTLAPDTLLQVMDYRLLDKEGKIPVERLPESGIPAASITFDGNPLTNGNEIVVNRATREGGFSYPSVTYYEDVLVLGNNATAGRDWTVALGSYSEALGFDSVAVGILAVADGGNGTALGACSESDARSVAVGSQAIATSENGVGQSTAVGYQAQARGNVSTTVGMQSAALGQASVALGGSAQATNLASVALGYGAISATPFSIALGASAKVTEANTYGVQMLEGTLLPDTLLQVKNYRLLDSEGKIPAERLPENIFAGIPQTNGLDIVLNYASAQNSFSYPSAITNQYSLVLGHGATVFKNNNVALGALATIQEGENAVAIGHDTFNIGNNSVTLGAYSAAEVGSVALGAHSAAISTDLDGYSVAVGYMTNAEGKWSTALGSQAWVSGQGGVAVGLQTRAMEKGALALGWGAEARQPFSVALGSIAKVTEANTYGVQMLEGTLLPDTLLQVKNYRLLDSEGKIPAERLPESGIPVASITFDDNPLINGNEIVVNYATGSGSFSYPSTVPYPEALVLGNDALSEEGYNVVLGSAAAALGGCDAIAIGADSTSNGEGAIAMGSYSEAGKSSVAIGFLASTVSSTNTTHAIAIGQETKATGESATAVGANATALGRGSVALGIQAHATDYTSVAIGGGALSKTPFSVALGASAKVTEANAYGVQMLEGTLLPDTLLQVKNYRLLDSEGKIPVERLPGGVGGGLSINDTLLVGATNAAVNAFAIGPNANAVNNGLAIGNNANANSLMTLAIGRNSTAAAQRSMAIGNGTLSEAGWGIALGISAKAKGERGIAIGLQPEAIGTDSISIGHRANAFTTAYRGIAIGTFAETSSTNSIALGYYAKIPDGRESGVQILDGLLSTNTLLQVKNYRLLDSEGKIPVERLPGGVGGGLTINDNLLAGATNAIAGAIAIGQEASAGSTASLAFGGRSLAKGPHSVAIGSGSEAATKDGIALGRAAMSSGLGSVAIGASAKGEQSNTVAIGMSSQASESHAIAIGSNAMAPSPRSITLGSKAEAAGANSVAIGFQAKTTVDSGPSIQLLEGTLAPDTLLQVMDYRLLDKEGKIPAERLPGGIGGGSIDLAVHNADPEAHPALMQALESRIDAAVSNAVQTASSTPGYQEISFPPSTSRVVLKHGCIQSIQAANAVNLMVEIDASGTPEGFAFDSILAIEVTNVAPHIVYPQGSVFPLGRRPVLQGQGWWYIGFGRIGNKYRVGVSGPFLELSE